MEYRTDLAVEYTEESTHRREEKGPFAVTRLTHEGSRYVTVESPPFSDTVDGGQLAELLAGELADLGGLLAVFLLDQIEVASGGDGRGVRLPKRRAILLVCSGGTGDLLLELGLSVFRLFQPLGVVALSGIALL